MRRELLYEYDLPVELLDDISPTEEVLEVFFARSEERNLLPILLTRERIVWAYPETATVYRIYELQYIDFVSAHAKYVTPPFPTLRIKTVDGQTYSFRHLVDAKEDLRGRLITLCGILKDKIGGNWRVWHKKSFLVDEYLLDRNVHGGAENIGGLPLCEPPSAHGLDDVFEDQPIPGKGCFESNETLFSHFPSDEKEDVFEEFTPGGETKPADSYADNDAKIARIVEEVEADIQKAQRAEEQPKVEAKPSDDSVIYGASSGKYDEQQWGEVNVGGDAEILADNQYVKRLEKINQQKTEYGPEDDDSVVYALPKGDKKKDEAPEIKAKVPPMYTKEDDDSIIYPTGNEEPVVITPMEKSILSSKESVVITPMKKAVQTEEDSVIITPMKKAVPEADGPVVITPMKKPVPEFEGIDRDEMAAVSTNPMPKPEFEGVDRDEMASVSSAPRPVDTLSDPVISSIPRPAYELDEEIKIAPRQKTPFEEANKDVITRMPTRGVKVEQDPRPAFTSQESLSPFLKASNLQPRPGFDSAAVDKLLEELKHLRDSGVITEEEYKERSLLLFRSE